MLARDQVAIYVGRFLFYFLLISLISSVCFTARLFNSSSLPPVHTRINIHVQYYIKYPIHLFKNLIIHMLIIQYST